MMMKKFALLAGLFVFAPMTWAQDYNIKNGLPSETYITCAEANEMAKTDSAQVAEIVAVMGNASVASRDLKIEQSPELSAKVVEKLNQVCAKDPQMLLITAIDDTMRAIGKNNISYVTASMNSTRFLANGRDQNLYFRPTIIAVSL
ncbi:YmgD family protein [Escherichia coli]|nr:hypothetical protein MUTS16_39500 [Escherichia coli]